MSNTYYKPEPVARYVSEPTAEQIEEVRTWIRANNLDYEDAFDCAVECSHSLGIFDAGVVGVAPREDRCVAVFVGGLVESFFAGSWS